MTLLFATCPFLPSVKDPLLASCDGVELRLDMFDRFDFVELQHFIRSCPIPVMLTLRRKREGGAFEGSEGERLHLIRRLAHLHPAWIDLESDIRPAFQQELRAHCPRTQFLSSYHNVRATPRSLADLFAHLRATGADAYKIATYAQSSLDALRLLTFARAQRGAPLTCLGMGPHGQLTRILSPVVGNAMCFAPLAPDHATAEGQIPLGELLSVYRMRTLNRHTQICGLMGHPVDESLGHVVHNASFAAHGINAVYAKMDVLPDTLPEALSAVKQLSFTGLSVTMPLKVAICPLVDHLAPDAERVRAVNTLCISHGKSYGYNTDGFGALCAIADSVDPMGKRAVLLGTGGVARAIAHALASAGARIEVCGRNEEKARLLAAAVGGQAVQEVHDGYDILVNCLPKIADRGEEWIALGKCVMDCVYTPKETQFLKRAAQKQCRAISGYDMFLHQALAQERLWFPGHLK